MLNFTHLRYTAPSEAMHGESFEENDAYGRMVVMQWAKQKQTGFTIVELLIVIVVIGILAAITIVAFNGVQARSRVASAQSNLSAISKKLEVYKVDNNRYPIATETSIWKSTIQEAAGDLSNGNAKSFIICANSGGDRYAVAAWSPVTAGGNQDLHYVSSDGAVTKMTYTGQGSYSSVGASVCAVIISGSMTAMWTQNL